MTTTNRPAELVANLIRGPAEALRQTGSDGEIWEFKSVAVLGCYLRAADLSGASKTAVARRVAGADPDVPEASCGAPET